MTLNNNSIVYQLKGLNPLVSILCVLLIMGSFLLVSCKKECVNNCNEIGLVLDSENCNCNCKSGLTSFEINGYTYCIEESEKNDIFVLNKYNIHNWIMDESECYLPYILLLEIPKALDSVESFNLLFTLEKEEYFYYFRTYRNIVAHSPCHSGGSYFANNFIRRFINDTDNYIFMPYLGWLFSDGFFKLINQDLFKSKPSLGLMQISENKEDIIFHVFGFKNFDDMFDASHNRTLKEIFDFPFIPSDSTQDPYDPLHNTLTFSRLNFD